MGKKFPNFSKDLEEFIHNQSTFHIIHTIRSTSNIQSKAQPTPSSSKSSDIVKSYVVLDSSFNPPHNGHFSLVEKFYEYHMKLKEKWKPDLLMLLSLKNADKASPNPREFEQRLSMIYLLAQHASKLLDVNVLIALTTQARFVDKSLSIFDSLGTLNRLTFLLGFDTVVRLFDERYYDAISLLDALGGFMSQNELFCLTRGDCEIQFASQFKHNIASSYSEKWSKSIHMIEGNSSVKNISSSQIRRNILEGGSSWESLVIPSIRDFIKTSGIYTESLIN